MYNWTSMQAMGSTKAPSYKDMFTYLSKFTRRQVGNHARENSNSSTSSNRSNTSIITTLTTITSSQARCDAGHEQVLLGWWAGPWAVVYLSGASVRALSIRGGVQPCHDGVQHANGPLL